MTKATQFPEPSGWDYSIFLDAKSAVSRCTRYRYLPDGGYDYLVQNERNPARQAWRQMALSKHLHPVVDSILRAYRPLDWQQLLLEWPYISDKDPTKLAYTPSEAYWIADRQVVTSIGKYLNRHWPHVADHIRRDFVAAYSCDEMQIKRTVEGIITGIELGARSCMQSRYGTIPFGEHHYEHMLRWLRGEDSDTPDWHLHPYIVYKPEYGWGMATRVKDNVVLGRGLVLDTEIDGEKVKGFVRTYSRRSDEESSSGDDNILAEWLKLQGFEKWGSWPNGAKIAKLPHPTKAYTYSFFTPYIDGGHHRVSEAEDHLFIDEDGIICCDNTDGGQENDDAPEYIGSCSCCGDAVRDDDENHIWAGYHEEDLVCGSCDDEYVYVYSSRGRYYLHRDNVESIVGDSYNGRPIDPDYAPDWARQAHDGQWYHEDDVYYVDSEGEYYPADEVQVLTDGTIVLAEDAWQCEGSGDWYGPDDEDDKVEYDGKTYHRDNCWQCEGSEEWYPDSVEPVELDDKLYHPDYLRAKLDEVSPREPAATVPTLDPLVQLQVALGPDIRVMTPSDLIRTTLVV